MSFAAPFVTGIDANRTIKDELLEAMRKQRDALHHVEEALRHFVERELLFVLNESKGWSAPHVTAGAIELCTNRVTMELACPALNAGSMGVTCGASPGAGGC